MGGHFRRFEGISEEFRFAPQLQTFRCVALSNATVQSRCFQPVWTAASRVKVGSVDHRAALSGRADGYARGDIGDHPMADLLLHRGVILSYDINFIAEGNI